MSNNVLEVRLIGSLSVLPEKNVIFNLPVLQATGIEYSTETGIITFKETGQYSIKWWVATETALRGTLEFQLISYQGSPFPLTPGCSPIKTGQVTGFGVIDVQEKGTTLALRNKSVDYTAIISKKAGTTAYMLITPIGAPSYRVYRANLSTPGSFLEVPLGGLVNYRLDYFSNVRLRLSISPIDKPVVYDFRRFSAYDGGGASEGVYSDGATLSGPDIKDTEIYDRSREMHWVVIRIQNPDTQLWSTYEVRLFPSGGISRVLVWVNTIEEDVSY